jgi:hypothetical protein
MGRKYLIRIKKVVMNSSTPTSTSINFLAALDAHRTHQAEMQKQGDVLRYSKAQGREEGNNQLQVSTNMNLSTNQSFLMAGVPFLNQDYPNDGPNLKRLQP